MCDGFGGACSEFVMPIIDDVMNLSLVMWAWRKTKNLGYYRILNSHMRNVKKYMLRDDFTVRHSLIFDSKSGDMLGERNFCGFAPGSIWARGQMWALYGFINALKATGDVEIYGDTINGQLNRLISLIGDKRIPDWDLCKLSEKPKFEDTSAAAIMAAAMLKLNDVKDIEENGRKVNLTGSAKNYNKIAEDIIEKLLSEYMYDDECMSILKGGQVGELSSGTVWGDYFIIEAIMKLMYGKECPDFWV